MKQPMIMISATSSNSGKTTITTALLKALLLKGLNVSAFKSGPDYIDPMFHKEVINVTSGNLDIFMMGENNCKYLLAKTQKDIAVIEGVMGYYDGMGYGTSGSTYELSKTLDCPVILVLNPSSMGMSIAAIVEGIKNFRKDSKIKGLILNKISKNIYSYYKKIIEDNTAIKVYGYMPVMENFKIESRHLGLKTTMELDFINEAVNELGQVALSTIDLDGIITLANECSPLEYEAPEIKYMGKTKIALAWDKCFNFYYNDSLEVLKKMGAEIIEFSPLNDKHLPADIDGLYIGGGYPELYMEELSGNKTMLNNIKDSVEKGLPLFAEGGGYMYLLNSFKDEKEYKLVGLIEGCSYMTDSLNNFGYCTLTSQNNNLLCHKGQSINAHEFHYSKSTNPGQSFVAQKTRDRSWKTIFANENIFAGYPHIHFLGNLEFAKNYIQKTIDYKKKER